MATVAEVYCHEIRRGLGAFLANWPPSEPVRIGDFGTVENDVFQRAGNLVVDFGISLDVQTNSAPAHYTYSSKNSTELNLRARGKAKLPTGDRLNAGLDLRFSAANAVFFNASGCHVESVSSPSGLKPAILKLLSGGKWQYYWHVITRRVTSQSCTVIVSSANGASISLDASGNVASIDLARGDLRMNARNATKIATQLVTAGDTVPIFSCHRLVHPLFRSLDWRQTRAAPSQQGDLFDPQKLAKAIETGTFKLEDFGWDELETDRPA
jgi:hypothetical protein